ncbi:hypothetical protein PTKIN_Ptkin07bG0278000 [Pterospermum kingtungense]
MWGAVLFLVALLIVGISHRWYTWANPKTKSHWKLPPGSSGWPIIGETLEFFSSHYLHYDIPPFFSKRMQRYGPVFRTNIVGKNLIVSTDPEINYHIFQQENKSFIILYTESFMKIFGKESLLAHHGNVHKYLKNLVLRIVSPENLKAKLLGGMDEATHNCLESWASFGNIDAKEGTAKMIFEYFAKLLIGYDEEMAPNGKLRDNFQAFMDGLISFPLNILGTAYHACLQGRKNACKVIKDMFEKRKASKTPHEDFLDYLLKKKEHEAILKARDEGESGLTWQEYKSMTFTHMVINETVRLANIVPGIFRKAVTDFEIKGYTIPAGWMVMVVPAAVHLSTDKYDNPLRFNPWRWEGQKLHAGSKTFMAFGGGIRLCVGADFAKLQVAILIHHMVTKYRWLVTRGGSIVRKPALIFPYGLHIEISKKQKC